MALTGLEPQIFLLNSRKLLFVFLVRIVVWVGRLIEVIGIDCARRQFQLASASVGLHFAASLIDFNVL